MATDPNSIVKLVATVDGGPPRDITIPMDAGLRALVSVLIDKAMTPATPPPTPLPTPLPAPTTPQYTRTLAGTKEPRGDGRTKIGVPNVTMRDEYVDGFVQNIVIQNVAQTTRLFNIISRNAHRPPNDPTKFYNGQCLYIQDGGDVYLSGYAGLFAGWQPGQDVRLRGGFYHDIYANWGCKRILIEDSIFWGAAHSGCQTRGYDHEPKPTEAYNAAHDIEVVLRRCTSVDCGIGFMATAGRTTYEDCIAYGGHRWYERDKNRNRDVYTGDEAVSSYTKVTLNNFLALGQPGQNMTTYGEPATAARFDMGALVGGQRYSDPHAGCSGGAKWTFLGRNVVRGWPGPVVSGDAAPPLASVSVDARGPKDVATSDLYNALAGGTRDVIGVNRELQSRIRAAAAAA